MKKLSGIVPEQLFILFVVFTCPNTLILQLLQVTEKIWN